MKKNIILLVIAIALSCQNLAAQAANSEIFLFSVDRGESERYLFTGGKNISNSGGYDNQPSFALDSGSIFFTSDRRENNFDIYKYNLADGMISALTSSKDNEYTAKELDEHTVTFVREGRDQLMTVIKFDRRTKSETHAFEVKEPIAYYAFNGNGDAFVWVRYAFFGHWINTSKSINRYVANYVQPSVPHLIPGTDVFSFMQRHPDDSLWIKEFDPKTEAVRPIIQSKDGKKDYCWMADGSLLIGSGSKLYAFDKNKDKNWVEVADLKSFGIKDVTRMSASADGKYLALVSNQ